MVLTLIRDLRQFGYDSLRTPSLREQPNSDRALDGLNTRKVAVYAHGLTVADIAGALRKLSEIRFSMEKLRSYAKAVRREEIAPFGDKLKALYTVVHFHLLRFAIRDEGCIRNQSVYVALALDTACCKVLLGLWVMHRDGYGFWVDVLTDLKVRGLVELPVVVVESPEGFVEASCDVFRKKMIPPMGPHDL